MKSILKYLIILPLVLFNFSCDDGPTDSTIYNGDLVGSWMLTELTGIYTYTVNLPDDSWAADTSFGIKLTWDKADDVPGGSFVQLWASEVKVGDVIPGVSDTNQFLLTDLQADTIGLIGVFEDAPSAGAYATYKMKGVYPSVGYNYGACTTALDKPDMGDRGIYTWDQTTYNFTIKRDPDIGGSQVLPAFDDGTLTFTDETMNTLNIKFLDRDAHSTRFAEIPDQTWNEGAHPSVNGINSGGDRSYMAFPSYLAVYNNVFVGAYDGTNGTPSPGPAYVMDPELAYWGGYMTWYAFNFNAEMGAKLDPAETDSFIGDVDGNGTVEAADLVAHMVGTILEGGGNTTATPFGVPYANIIDADSLAVYGTTSGVGGKGNGLLKNDSDSDVSIMSLNDGGKLQFVVSRYDCAVPADVTIDFDATFKRCTTDNCAGDNYHVEPVWD